MFVYRFEIVNNGDAAAGMHPYSNSVTVISDYDPGESIGQCPTCGKSTPYGDVHESQLCEDNFEQYILFCLHKWFDGSNVTICDIENKMEK